MYPAITGSLISAGGNLLSNLLGFGSQAMTNKSNMKLAEYQYQKNLEMWNRNNEYNSPVNQMKRLSEAGLNPNLVYGHGSISNTSTSTPAYQAPNLQAYTNFSSLGQAFIDGFEALRSKRLDNEKKEEEINNIKADTDNKENKNPLLKAQSKLAEAQAAESELRREIGVIEKELKGKERDFVLASYNDRLAKLVAERRSAEYEVNELQPARLANINADTDNKNADTNIVKPALANSYNASAEKNRADALNIRSLMPILVNAAQLENELKSDKVWNSKIDRVIRNSFLGSEISNRSAELKSLAAQYVAIYKSNLTVQQKAQAINDINSGFFGNNALRVRTYVHEVFNALGFGGDDIISLIKK